MGKHFTAENEFANTESVNKNDAKKYLNNYLGQLKLHFNLSDGDVIKIMESELRSRKNDRFVKKWWHIWK